MTFNFKGVKRKLRKFDRGIEYKKDRGNRRAKKSTLIIQQQDVCLFVCLYVPYLLRNGWTDLANLFFVSSVLVTGWFQAEKIPDPSTGSPEIREKPVFIYSAYITLYYRIRMSSISETAKPIVLKFCRNLLLGPRMVLGYKFSRFIHQFVGNP